MNIIGIIVCYSMTNQGIKTSELCNCTNCCTYFHNSYT